ncbi:hypothetical protein C8Q79DRAFT_443227 [Trametes meyenii]|nr:hypothetical protein C8Q79DRAFT_443227 [Trametes meyenii]
MNAPDRPSTCHASQDINGKEVFGPVSFTKDTDEATAVTCQRPSCESGRHFPPGTQLWFVASKESGEGRYVCQGCHEYYAGKQRASGHRDIAFTHANMPSSGKMINGQNGNSVRKLVAAGQRGDKSVAHVQAIGTDFIGQQSHGGGSSFGSGPIVRIPGRGGVGIGQLANSFPPPLPGIAPMQWHGPIASETGARCAVPANIGYNLQHMLYHDKREQAARAVYAGGQGTSGHVVVVRFWIALQPTKPSGSPQPVGGITETISDVDVHIGAKQLKQLAWDQLRPVWQRYAEGFPLSLDVLTLRDQHWARIDPKVPDVDAIASLFFKQDKRKPAPPGQEPVKKFDVGKGATVYLHLPPEVHQAFEDHLEARALERLQESSHSPLGPPTTLNVHTESNQKTAFKLQTASQSGYSFIRDATEGVRESKLKISVAVPSKRTRVLMETDSHKSSDMATQRSQMPYAQPERGHKSARLDATDVPASRKAIADIDIAKVVSKKTEANIPNSSSASHSTPSSTLQQHAQESNRDSVSKHSGFEETSKSSRSTTRSTVNHDALFLALLKQQTPSVAGVKPLFNLKTIIVQARPVLHFADVDTLAELSTSIAGLDYLGEPVSGRLILNTSVSATKHGAFKRAQFGKLLTDEPLFEHILSPSSSNVPSQELENMVSSGGLSTSALSILVCAKQAVYPTPHGTSNHPIPHISHQQGKLLMTEVQCLVWARALLKLAYDFVEEQVAIFGSAPIAVPQMRFVQAALAITDGTDSTHPTAYLIEENIPMPSSGMKWRKYINNDSPKPIPQYEITENKRAQFLAFTQHVQMWKTHGLAIVTDYQGCGSLLSDPQINTNPRLGNLFAAGNIPNVHRTFVEKHKCTKFCHAYNLPSIPDLGKLLDKWNAELDPPPPSGSELSTLPESKSTSQGSVTP